MEALLILSVVLLYTAQSFFCRLYTERYPGRSEMASPVFTVVSGLSIALITFAVAGLSFSAHWVTLLLGIGNALVLFGYNSFLIRASQLGSYAIMMVFSVAGGIILPAISATAFGDDISIPQILSILVIFVAVYMVSHKDDGGAGSNHRGFLPACFGLAITNGLYGVLLDAQNRLTGAAEKEEMLILTFGGAALFSLLLLVSSQKKAVLSVFRQTPLSFLFLLACVAVAATAANILVYVLQIVDPTLLYTFNNAGVLLLSVLASCLFFKEKLSRLNAVGCVLMCAALVCFSLL
ncbi:MAG: hypothetical protein IJ012_06750 [Clostridia bacterium]|nr:hypothetical protein [Clostridia bacterium]